MWSKNCLPLDSTWVHPSLFVRFVLFYLLFSVYWFVDRCLSFFFWPLHCLSFDLRLLITPLVSSNFSYKWSLFRSKIILIILFFIWCEMTLNSGLLNIYWGFSFMKYGLHNRLWVSGAIFNNYILLWKHGYFVNTTNLPKSLTNSNT